MTLSSSPIINKLPQNVVQSITAASELETLPLQPNGT